jgi:hypothetical protein
MIDADRQVSRAIGLRVQVAQRFEAVVCHVSQLPEAARSERQDGGAKLGLFGFLSAKQGCQGVSAGEEVVVAFALAEAEQPL